jgi:hypothetical protein
MGSRELTPLSSQTGEFGRFSRMPQRTSDRTRTGRGSSGLSRDCGVAEEVSEPESKDGSQQPRAQGPHRPLHPLQPRQLGARLGGLCLARWGILGLGRRVLLVGDWRGDDVATVDWIADCQVPIRQVPMAIGCNRLAVAFRKDPIPRLRHWLGLDRTVASSQEIRRKEPAGGPRPLVFADY